MYKCRHFDIKELVPEHVFEDRGEKAWQLLDERALETLDLLRDVFGPITVNDWSWGGANQWRGLRTPQSPWYSQYSQHTFGRAFDCIFKHATAEEVRRDISKYEEEFPFINSIEADTSWLHFDTRNVQRIMTFKP